MTTSNKEPNKRKKLFGTDGIRSRVGQFPLDDPSVRRLGFSLASLPNALKIVIGSDTRASGKTIANCLTAGIQAANPDARVSTCGVIPTPGLSYITSNHDFDYGIMITASHNPYTDNGIKIFHHTGEKLPDAMEVQLESYFFSLKNDIVFKQAEEPIHIGGELYYEFLKSHIDGLADTGYKVVLDCAHGATYETAPRLFAETGLDVTVTHAAPDGRNINRDCGSTHMDRLSTLVSKAGADLGIGFDGDGDRVLFVDRSGNLLDGDYVLLMLARYFKQTRTDFNSIVVGTVMGNLGLEKKLTAEGFQYLRTGVGDKQVYQEMKQKDALIGGEQSGHTILKCFGVTGDGILTALYFLRALSYLGIRPEAAFGQLELFPQVICNIDVKEKKSLDDWPQLTEMSDRFEADYADNSRLLIRYSGTEPKLRIMMESRHQSIIQTNLNKFEQLIRSTIGK